jgi:hypothetical protein
VRSATRGIVDAVDPARPAGDINLVTFLWNEERTAERNRYGARRRRVDVAA